MKINNTVNIPSQNNKNQYISNFNGGKNCIPNCSDSVSFSDTKKEQKTESLKQKILNLLGIKSKTNTEINEEDFERAKKGFKAYQYQSSIINTALRNSETPEEAITALSQMSKNFLDGNETEAYFVEKGFDLLSKPVEKDVTVYRYIYSSNDYNVDWKTGDKIYEKGFISTTSDNSENSYPKYYVKENLKNYNKYSETEGQFYTMEITIPKGTKVVKGDDRMNEILIKYGSTFEIIDFDEKTNTYKCKIIN